MSDTIHIAYRSSDIFAELVTTSIASILSNTKRACHFYVYGHNLGDAQRAKMISLKKTFPDFQLEFVDFNAFDYPSEIDFNEMPLHPCWQLVAPWVFGDLKKIIYMCGDTIIEDDISKLWDMDMGDNYYAFGPVPNILPFPNEQRKTEVKKALGIPQGREYLNFGVVLASLVNIRSDYNLISLYKDYIQKKKIFESKGFPWALAQDYAVSLNSKVIELPPCWNVTAGYGAVFDVPEDSFDMWVDAYKSPKVIHYVSCVNKPAFLGHIHLNSRFIDRYFHYKALTPYADIVRDRIRLEKYEWLLTGTAKGFLLRLEQNSHADNYHVPLLQMFAKFMHDSPFDKQKLAIWGKSRFLKTLLLELKLLDIEPDIIVDGLPENHGKMVFKWKIESPDILKEKSDEYGVVVASANFHKDIANTLAQIGYEKQNVRHAFFFADVLELSSGDVTDWGNLYWK